MLIGDSLQSTATQKVAAHRAAAERARLVRSLRSRARGRARHDLAVALRAAADRLEPRGYDRPCLNC